jgi:hypothetical protein
MKTWRRATIAEVCGRCGGPIAVGDPELQYQFTAVPRPLRRCPACAGEPVPSDLPELAPVDVGVVGGGERSIRSVRDWKQRQAGDVA